MLSISHTVIVSILALCIVMHFIYVYIHIYFFVCLILVQNLFRCCRYGLEISCVDSGWDKNESNLG